MIYTPMTKKAIKLLYDKQKNQLDKSGIPYIFHPFHVAESMDDEISTVVALLHDIVEDTDLTFLDLSKLGFPDEVVDTLKLLTHSDNEDYFEYISKISQNPIATKVKKSDLLHNMDLQRLDFVTEKDFLRKLKYEKAYFLLEEKKNKKL